MPRSKWHRVAICKQNSCTAIPLAPSNTRGRLAQRIVQDVVNGRGLVLERSSVFESRGLRVLPLGTVEARKQHIIHDLAFAGDVYRSSVNDGTDFFATPLVTASGIFVDGSASRRGVRTMLYRIDVKDAFHQIPVDLPHAAKFGYVFKEYAAVDVF